MKHAAAPRSRTYVNSKPVLALALFAFMAFTAFNAWQGKFELSLFGAVVFPILGTKLILSLVPEKKYPEPRRDFKVAVVITLYNEDPALFEKCLDSILSQHFPPAQVIVVDDASLDTAAYDYARMLSNTDERVVVLRHEVNSGKRHALASGFRAAHEDTDVFMCIDSDSYLTEGALKAGIRPFADPEVSGVSGMVVPANNNETVLTRIQDVRYVNSFVGERAAYSTLDSVLCVCGAMAFWRASVVRENLNAFLNQRFLGELATVGDDRHLTNLCLKNGKVVLATKALSFTAVPEKLGHYVRQQARWGRSFFRESYWALTNLRPRRPAWWLTLVELLQLFGFSAALLYILIVGPIITGEVMFSDYLIMTAIMAIARAVRFFDLERAGQSLFARITSFAVAPLYGFMNLLVLLPLRFWSLLTLRRVAWGTRSRVEVSAS